MTAGLPAQTMRSPKRESRGMDCLGRAEARSSSIRLLARLVQASARRPATEGACADGFSRRSRTLKVRTQQPGFALGDQSTRVAVLHAFREIAGLAGGHQRDPGGSPGVGDVAPELAVLPLELVPDRTSQREREGVVRLASFCELDAE